METLHEDLRTFMKKILLNSYGNEKYFRHNCREDQIPHIVHAVTFFFKENRAVYEIMRKNIGYNKAHAHCMLDTQGYKHTLRICNVYCYSTTTMVARTHLDVPLY